MIQSIKDIPKEAAFTLLGVVLIKFSTGVITCWGSINLYIMSYFYFQGYQISQLTNSVMILLMIIPMSLLTLFATKLSDRFGYEKVIKVCGYIFFLSPFVMYFWFNMFTLSFFCMFLPISSFAISSIPVINCLWTQFPESKNKATAIAVICFGVGGVVWNYLFTLQVNPDNEPANIIDPISGMNMFSQNVASRIIKCLNIGFFICGLLFVIGTHLVKKNTNYRDSHDHIETEMRDMKTLESIMNEVAVEQKKAILTLKEALKDKRFIFIFLISFVSGVFQTFLNMNLKIIYLPIINDDLFLVYCAMAGTAVSIGGAFFWGYIGDKKGFLSTLIFFSIFDCLIKFYGMIAKGKTSLMILFILIGFVDKAMLTIMGPGFVKMFGLGLATELLPYKGISVFLCFLIAPIGYVIFSSMMSPFTYLMSLAPLGLISPILAYYLYKIEKNKSL